MAKYKISKDVESSKGGKFIKNEIVEGTPVEKLKGFVNVNRKNTSGDNQNYLVLGFDLEQVDDSTPLTPVSNLTTTIVEDKIEKSKYPIAMIGVAVGLGFAYYRKSSVGGYVGYAILGSVIAQIGYNLTKKK
jgi:hypothetical protein